MFDIDGRESKGAYARYAVYLADASDGGNRLLVNFTGSPYAAPGCHTKRPWFHQGLQMRGVWICLFLFTLEQVFCRTSVCCEYLDRRDASLNLQLAIAP